MKILRLSQVKERTGLSKSTIYQRMLEGRFPVKISLGGGHAVGWLESEIDEYLSKLISQSREERKQQ